MKKFLLPIAIFAFGFISAPKVFAATSSAVSLASATSTKNIEKIFYYSYLKSGVESFKEHASEIDIFAPQAYTVYSNLSISGGLSSDIKQIVAQNHTKVMPLVVNNDFSQSLIHNLLASSTAQDNIINYLISEGKKQGYYGWQLDFEHIYYTDRDAYTAFVKKAYAALHAQGLILSVAVAARTNDEINNTYKNWGGVFDYSALAQNSDFLSVMAYDDPNSQGPPASIPFDRAVLAYLKNKVPPEKISLGIPLYYWGWQLNPLKRVSVGSYSRLEFDRNTFSCQEGFDQNLGVPWLTYSYAGVKYQIWYENQASFQEKYDLVGQYGLRGFSAWVLGLEDPGIWNVLTGGKLSGVNFDSNLMYGQSSSEVKNLQVFLNQFADTMVAESGAGSPGKETDFFGAKTLAAVKKFQEKYSQNILAPLGLVRATGFVGKSTRAKINELIN